MHLTSTTADDFILVGGAWKCARDINNPREGRGRKKLSWQTLKIDFHHEARYKFDTFAKQKPHEKKRPLDAADNWIIDSTPAASRQAFLWLSRRHFFYDEDDDNDDIVVTNLKQLKKFNPSIRGRKTSTEKYEIH